MNIKHRAWGMLRVATVSEQFQKIFVFHWDLEKF